MVCIADVEIQIRNRLRTLDAHHSGALEPSSLCLGRHLPALLVPLLLATCLLLALPRDALLLALLPLEESAQEGVPCSAPDHDFGSCVPLTSSKSTFKGRAQSPSKLIRS